MANNAINLENLWATIGAVSRNEVRLAVLQDEIEIHKSRLQPHGTGSLHDTIAIIKKRIDEIQMTKIDLLGKWHQSQGEGTDFHTWTWSKCST